MIDGLPGDGVTLLYFKAENECLTPKETAKCVYMVLGGKCNAAATFGGAEATWKCWQAIALFCSSKQ